MNEDHAVRAPVGPARELVAPPRRSEARHGHSRRFFVATAALVALGIGSLAVALALTVSGGHRRVGGGDWSAWKPQSGGLTGAQEIADFVAPYYRATASDQLAVVTAVNLNDPNKPLQVVVPSTNSSAGLAPLSPGSTLVYNLCGVGSHDCSIGVGQASSDRLLLLRREGLELALYGFKYIGGIDTVVAILPPGHQVVSSRLSAKPPTSQSSSNTKPLDIALAFDRKELGPWLNRPLRDTLPEALPPTVSQMSHAPEAELVSVITAHGLFKAQSEQAQDGSTVIVLQPMPPQ